jgi:flagellar basal-body rod modification protein FlgD
MSDISNLLPPGLQGLAQRQQAKDQPQNEGLGQNEFFELMIAQLKHQDPLNPLSNQEFIGQVAQFSTANGVQEMRDSIGQLAGAFQSSQALQASTLVGRNVLVASNTIALSPDQMASGAVELPQGASGVTINISSPSGGLVRRLELGRHPAGLVHFTWDGLGNDGEALPPGNYVMQAEKISDGERGEIPVLVQGQVESVTLNQEPSGLTLNVKNRGSVPLADVRQVL